MEFKLSIIQALIAIIPALIAASCGVITLIVSLRHKKELASIRIELNGRLSQLLESIGKEQRSEGVAEGRRNLRAEQKEEKEQ